MQSEESIREIATRACCEALQEKSQELAEDFARRMAVALGSPSHERERTKELRDGAVLIAGSRSQTEALERLLAASSAITPECGLMILHGAQAIGWNCHGLATLENFKRTTLDCTGGVAARVISSGAGVATQGSQLDAAFLTRLGLKSTAQVLVVPVLLKERVAALLIAVTQQNNDIAGLELLVQVAELTLDLQAYRKGAPRPSVNPPQQRTDPQRGPAQPPQTAPVAPRPEAGYGTAYGAGAATRITVAAPQLQPERVNSTSMPTVAPSSAEAQVAVPGMREGVAQAPMVLDEAHETARRFAKLLVEEIKLYNQTKVAEGRARGDLYSRLREDIEKSRAAYQKRYGERIKDVDYFSQELIRILADNNRTVMGTGFPG